MSIASLDRKESADYTLLLGIENPSKLYHQSIIVNVIFLGIFIEDKRGADGGTVSLPGVA